MHRMAALLLLLVAGCVFEEPVRRPNEIPAAQPEYRIISVSAGRAVKTGRATGQKGKAVAWYDVEATFEYEILDPGWEFETMAFGPFIARMETKGRAVKHRRTVNSAIRYLTPVFKYTGGVGERRGKRTASVPAPEGMVKDVEWRIGKPADEKENRSRHCYKSFYPDA